MHILRLTLATILATATVSAGPILGQIDRFSTASTLNWTNGAPGTDPVVISTGGPGGAGDGYLQVTATGAGPTGRLTVFNRTQWTGDFSTPGVFLVEMDLANFGASALSMRLALKSGTLAASPGFVSTTAFALAADSNWHHATFLLDAADLTLVGSGLTLSALLSGVAEMRIINAPTTSLTGVNVVGQIGIDNISATAPVPEPGTILLFVAALLAGGLWRLRRGLFDWL